ncbi:hypothetical protein ACLOJK_032169 [Asimina triloba]
MAKEYTGDKHYPIDSKRQRLTWVLGVSGLCILFYVLGAWQNSSPRAVTRPEFPRQECDPSVNPRPTVLSGSSSSSLDFEAHHQVSIKAGTVGAQVFSPCSLNYSEYTPCQDTNRAKKFDRDRLIYRERHCPKEEELLRCLIPAPPKYKNPFKWPRSRDYAWYDNIPHRELSIEKAVQNWIQVEGDRFRFPGGGTMFPRGADAYIDDINQLITLTDGKIRTAIDTGCGVASWGAYLLKRDILTMSFAPRDTHEAQVQFALERGVPAMIGVLASERMPYPARSFDMAHCSRCLIPWQEYGKDFIVTNGMLFGSQQELNCCDTFHYLA